VTIVAVRLKRIFATFAQHTPRSGHVSEPFEQNGSFQDPWFRQALCRSEPGAEVAPFANAAPLPIAATIALEMIGSMPRTVISRSQAAS
jgi:hypothetical protein